MKTLQFFLLMAGVLFIYVLFGPENKELMAVEYVIDGDTFHASGRRVRVWGIDTPEKDEPYFQEATLHLKKLIDKQSLDCVLIDQDKYERDVMRCYFEGDDISKIMVRAGMARDYKRYSDSYYRRAENAARKENLGIWSE